jgi:hypothetical protein
MSSIAGLNNFNNLLYATHKRAVYDALEHKAGRVGLDFRFKGYENINEVLTTRTAQITANLEIVNIFQMKSTADLIMVMTQELTQLF